MDGWIKLHRKFLEWGWYDDVNTFKVFIHILLSVNSKPGTWRGIDIEPGQLITGRLELANRLKLSEMQIRTALNKLKSTNEITIKTTPQYSVITVKNWTDYQHDNQQNNQQITNKQPTNNQRITTNKNARMQEEENILGSLENEPPQVEKIESKKKGSRLPENWVPSSELLAWAKKERPDVLVEREIEIFRDYWIAQPGQKGVKLDWDATFKNWIRRANSVQGKLFGQKPSSGIPGTQIIPAEQRIEREGFI
jgi:hypothetical protein